MKEIVKMASRHKYGKTAIVNTAIVLAPTKKYQEGTGSISQHKIKSSELIVSWPLQHFG